MLLRCQISFIFCQLFTLFFSFFLVFFYVFQPSRPYSILDILQLYNKESASHTLCSLSGSASCVAVIGGDIALYQYTTWFLIQLVMFIIGLLSWIFLVGRQIDHVHLFTETKPSTSVGIRKWEFPLLITTL